MTGEELNKVIFLSGWGLLSMLTVRRRRFNAEKERAQGKFMKAGQEGHFNFIPTNTEYYCKLPFLLVSRQKTCLGIIYAMVLHKYCWTE